MDELLIALCIGMVIVDIILTIALFVLKKKRRCLGRLIINMSDPIKDIYQIDLDDLQDLEKEKVVFLKVVVEGNTQK